MKKFFVIINRFNRRDALLGRTVCFEEAETDELAIEQAWSKHGSDSTTLHCAFEITDEKDYFTVLN